VRPAPGGRRGRGMVGGVVYDASGDAGGRLWWLRRWGIDGRGRVWQKSMDDFETSILMAGGGAERATRPVLSERSVSLGGGIPEYRSPRR
jgi:hypothetical protein